MMLIAGIGMLGGVAVLLCCWRRYELAIGMILLSPWFNWLLYSNVARTAEEKGETGAASYFRILLVLMVGCCGAMQIFKSLFTGEVKRLPKYLICFGLFVLYAVLSTGYSLDRKFTFIRSSEFLIFYMFLVGFYFWLNDRFKLDSALNVYYWIIVVGMMLNVAALILMPHRVWAWNMPDRFLGLTDHPNMFGALCALSYPIFAWKYATSRGAGKYIAIVFLLITAVLHILSGSRSSIVASILGGIIWLFSSVKKISLRHIAACLVFTIIMTCSVSFLLLTKPASMRRGDEAITTLTGRTDFWKGCLMLIKEQPIQGYGYGVAGKVWEDPRFQKEGEFLWVGSARSSLHNGYLSVAIGLGLVGLMIWLVIIGIPIYGVLRLGPTPYKVFSLMMIVPLLMLNFFESALSSGSQIYTSLVFWIVLIIAGRLPRLLGAQTEIMSSHKDANVGYFNSTKNIPGGLCAGYTGA